MPANPRQQPAQSPSTNTTATTSKYTNKDGSKFITIPKFSSSTESSQTSPTMAQTTMKTNGQVPNPSSANPSNVPTVNRKKQKRRQKQAEKLAAEAAGRPNDTNGAQNPSQNNRPSSTSNSQPRTDADYRREHAYDSATGERIYYSDDDVDAYSGSYEHSASPPNGYAVPATNSPSKSGKRKGKGKTAQPNQANQSPNNNVTTSSMIAPTTTLRMSKEKIWNTSSQEERERIKVFWLSLGEEERRSLVKVEKDAVLKKMKEQQKHSCSCTVCGRKRIAIEEELEVLYDAYYEELEQYANNQQGDKPPPMLAGSRRFGALSGLQPPNLLPPAFSGRHPSRGRIVEHFADEEDEDDGEGGYTDDEEEDYISDEDPVEEIPRSHATDFFNFGQSLTVQGGILTVADDLLKNDGKKFIEMMEQLAERRMAREEDAKEHYTPNGYPHPNGLPPHSHHNHHNHPSPADDEDDYDDEEEDDDEYDSQEEDYDEEEMDTMTEEQRMEEGRRMFQIFAARMFEQRVLTAYKEKVAAERQEKLLQELDEEDMAVMQKKAKKAKEAQKKKEKAQQKKLALAEEKAKRDAEKAAEEAARLAEEAQKAEEARLRAEEKRKKREAQKKAEEEERMRKEAEKQRRIQEQRERQAEQERKAREAKEREKREKEELRQKEREAKEAKDRELREKKEMLEKEKKEAELKARAEREAKEQRRREEAQQQGKRSQQHIPIPTPAGLQSGQANTAHFPIVTPAIPKAPTPNRPAIPSQRDPVGSIPQTPQFGSAKSQSTSPNPSTPLQNSPGPQILPGRTPSQPFLHHPQASSPMHSALKGPLSGFQPGPFPGMQPMGMNGFQPGFPPMAPGFGGRMHHEPMFPHQPFGNQFRPLSGPNGAPMYPGMNSMPIPQGRGFPGQHVPPPGFPPQMTNGLGGLPQGFHGHKETAPAHMHSRQQSAGSFEKPASDPAAPGAPGQPIARPAPIGRPGSVVHGHRSDADVDDLTNHLGSSALLDDSDEPIVAVPNARRASAAPGSLGRQGGFGPSMAYGIDPSTFSSPGAYSTWGGPPNPFGTGSLPGSGYMSGWANSTPSGFGGVGGMPTRPSQPRSVAVRLMLCRACKILEGSSPDNFYAITAVREQIDRLNSRDEPVSEKELLDLCETEGNPTNGGGFFDVRNEDGRVLIRYEADTGPSHRPVGAPGDIGSPIVGSASMMPMNRFPPGISAPGGGF